MFKRVADVEASPQFPHLVITPFLEGSAPRLPKRAKKPLSVMSPVAAPHRGNGSSALDFEALTQRL